jgi:cyanate permease
MAGVSGPALSGLLVDWTGHFAAAFAVAAAITLCGALSWCLGVPRLEQVKWLDDAVAISEQPHLN